MQQILVILSADADSGAISTAVENNSGSLHSSLDPAVLLVDGDATVRDALKATAGVVAALSDDDAKAALAATDVTQLDIPGLATFLGTTLGTNTSFEEPVVLAVSGWMYGLSNQYTAKKSDRPRDGETWDMDGGCLPTDGSFANA
jgi:hypothetical protein